MALTGFDNIHWQVEELKEFSDYWRTLPKVDQIPLRSSFNPADVTALLPDVTIYEYMSETEIKVRLAGTRLVDAFGQEITGDNFLEFWPSSLRKIVAQAYRSMLETPSGLLVKIIGVSESGSEKTGYSVGFPLRTSEEECNLLIFYNYGEVFPEFQSRSEDKILSLRVDQQVFIDLSEDC